MLCLISSADKASYIRRPKCRGYESRLGDVVGAATFGLAEAEGNLSPARTAAVYIGTNLEGGQDNVIEESYKKDYLTNLFNVMKEEEVIEVNKPRVWYTYKFKHGNEVIHGGRTQEPERREQDHQRNIDPKGHLKIIGRAKTEEGARKWEKENGYS